MAGVEQPCYTLINFPNDSEPHNEMQLKLDLEKGDIKKKIEALKKTIGIILSGDKIPGLLMTIIRFVLPLQDHTIKKLLLIFWEIVPKTSPDGKLLQEMILVCDAYRKDLQHPNEFIRGSTLRFLCKLKEPELLEPLMPSIRTCLEHRHSYVRRNAVLAIFTIYRNFEFLIPDAPELISKFLESEQDMSCKRNAFLMLLHAEQERALAYLAERLDSVHGFGDILQLVIVELIYKVCHANPSERSRFIRTVYGLLNAGSGAVRYEAAGTLATLSHAPAAIKAAAACYIDLIVKESDNNVKLIVIHRLSALRSQCGEGAARALPELAMDVLRVLQASDLDVRRHTLHLALELVPARHAEELVQVLRKEALRSQDNDDAASYRQLLVRAMHQAATKFPEVSASVGPALLEMLGDGSSSCARDVLVFLRYILHAQPQLADTLYPRLLECLRGIKCGKSARAALWLPAQFADTRDKAAAALNMLKEVIPDDAENKQESPAPQASDSAPAPAKVTSDGAYATQSAFNLQQSTTNVTSLESGPPLRQALVAGDSFTVTCACSALASLSLKLDARRANQAMHLAAVLLNYHKQKDVVNSASALTADDWQQCCRSLLSMSARWSLGPALLDAAHAALNVLPHAPAPIVPAAQEDVAPSLSDRHVPVETGISFSALAGVAAPPDRDVLQVSLDTALLGGGRLSSDTGRLSRVTQLTGFSDPVYAEAIVSVNQYDIVLDILIVNQTDDTLQNCCVELATLGELRLVERPAPLVLGPRDFATIAAHVKVASTENGIIFGNIVYEVSGSSLGRGVVVLKDVHVDIVDYIRRASCSDAEFRHMWAEFEWENKVSVNTSITDLREYLHHLLASTNMQCLTPDKALSGQCGFMAANLYAKSIFGEDALANLSIETPLNKPGAPVVGHVRIRAKSQGMALSLGDKINMMHKSPPPKPALTPAA